MDSLLDDAFELLELATKLEEGAPIEAATKMYEATYLLKRYIQRLPVTPDNMPTRQLLEEKVSHYEKLASSLLNQDNHDLSNASQKTEPESPFSKHCQFFDDTSVIPIAAPSLPSPRFENASIQSTVVASITEKVAQANTRLAHALDLDESGEKESVIKEYMLAAELYLEAIKMADSAGDGAQSVVSLLKRRLAGALDRVDELKHPNQRTVVREHKVRDQSKQKGSPLSDTEISVLKRSSLIASGLFLPWSDDDAQKLSEEAQRPTIATASLWTDPDGFLKLSDKQRARFHKWARPPDICLMRRKQGLTSTLQKPVMVKSITPFTIRQQYVTDCSFIASLCICAAFERRFGRKLVTSLIYPQDTYGIPMISPSGRYQVKLWLNGIPRQVVVDDYLPVDKFGNMLCSHTTAKGLLELWVSLVEKAYMKLCGGYDFPGSNSGVDLFSLTGWIPERIFFPKDPSKVRDFETPSERAWERLCSASSFGDCLITMSTSSDLEEDMADQVGLVTGHAYAVLSVVQTRNGTRLCQLKNPWSYKGWRGRYSCHDLASWKSSPGLCNEVGYDPVLAQKHDDGIFWIEWKDVLVYFQNIHLSWNPGLFSFHTTVHGFWPLNQGPLDDMFNVGDNPQYVLKLSDSAISKKATIWILLSRHVAKQEQEGSEATDYLTVHAHQNNEKRGVVWYPGGKSCILTGAYTNNPHVLMRYDVSGPADKYLSLVLSQYKKSNDLAYTLSCYCTEPFALSQPAKGLPLSTELSGEWTELSAGGPPGTRTFQNNPMYAFRVPDEGVSLQMSCSAGKSIPVNVMAVAVDSFGKRVKKLSREPVLDSGDYRHGFTVAERMRVPSGVYTLIVSSFHPGQVGSFRLVAKSSAKLKFERIP